MTSPRLEINLDTIEANTRALTHLLTPRGIRIAGVTKGVGGSPEVARAMIRGGAHCIAESRIDNIRGLRKSALRSPVSLIRTPMLSQARQVVELADVSFNTELGVLEALSAAAQALGRKHRVVLLVELGDLRDGIPADELVDAARAVLALSGLELEGIGANLACLNGVIPDHRNMAELSELAERVERTLRVPLRTISGGNSANLGWVARASDVGRVNELRLGEAILLGTDPIGGERLTGLSTQTLSLVGEVIEIQEKAAQPWGQRLGATAFGPALITTGAGMLRRAIVAIGRQDADMGSIEAVDGYRVLGMSSDHVVLDVGAAPLTVGDEMRFHLGYSSLLRASGSRSVALQFEGGAVGQSALGSRMARPTGPAVPAVTPQKPRVAEPVQGVR